MGKNFLGFLITLAIFGTFLKGCVIQDKPLINVCKDNKWGAITLKNKQVIPYKYDFLSQFVGNRAVVLKNLKYGVINKKDKLIVPLEYDMIFDYSEGVASAKKDKKFGYIDKSGKVIIPFEYDLAETFSNNLALVSKKEKWGYIDKKNNIVIPLKFKNAKNFVEGIAAVSEDSKKWGIINKKGEFLIKPIYDYIAAYNSKEISVCNSKKNGELVCGIISPKNGKEIIPIKYTSINLYSEGYYAVKTSGDKWKFINKKGRTKSKEYSLVYDYKKNLAVVCIAEDKCGVINKRNKEIIPPKYEIVSPYFQGLTAVMKNGKWGFFNKKGKLVIPFEYDWTGLIF